MLRRIRIFHGIAERVQREANEWLAGLNREVADKRLGPMHVAVDPTSTPGYNGCVVLVIEYDDLQAARQVDETPASAGEAGP